VSQGVASRDENARKKCRPHKNDAFTSKLLRTRLMSGVEIFGARIARRAIEPSVAAGMRFESRFAIRDDAWAAAKLGLVARLRAANLVLAKLLHRSP
jgi:hypothetical protein